MVVEFERMAYFLRGHWRMYWSPGACFRSSAKLATPSVLSVRVSV